MRSVSLWLGLGAASALGMITAWPGHARADAPTTQTPKKGDRDAARRLAERGFEALQQGRYDEAITLLRQAEEHFHAPTHLVYVAQAQARKGSLLEAADTYRRVVGEALPREAPQPFVDAQNEASRALSALLQRTPKLRVEVAGADPATTRVNVGERAILAGASTYFDPGSYVVRVSAEGGRATEARVTLAESGGEVVVRVAMARATSPVWPITTFTIGGVTSVAAIAMGLVANEQLVTARAACQSVTPCPEDDARKLVEAGRLRDAAIVVGVTGGLALAAGITLLVVRSGGSTTVEPASAGVVARRPGGGGDRSAGSAGPSLAVKIGPGFAGVTGSF